MKTWLRSGVVFGGVILLLCAVTPSYGQEVEKKAQQETASTKSAAIKCPVCDQPVQLSLSAGYKDAKVYFCCPTCQEKFKSDSKPFAEAADAQLKAIAAGAKVIQFACPMCSKPHKAAVKRSVKKGLLGVKLLKVYFCCDDCATAFEKEDGKAATEKLESVLTSQTACPFDGMPINIEVSEKYKGKRIFFCSKGCAKKFEKDKDGVLAKLKAGAGFETPAKAEKAEKEKAKGEKAEKDKP